MNPQNFPTKKNKLPNRGCANKAFPPLFVRGKVFLCLDRCLGCEHRSAWESFTDRRNGTAERIQGPLPWILTRQVPFGAQFLKANPHFNEPPSGREVARERETEGACATLEFAQILFHAHSPSPAPQELPPGGSLLWGTCASISLPCVRSYRKRCRVLQAKHRAVTVGD